jgi:hypothetical protein
MRKGSVKMLKEGQKVYGLVRSVSNSGMSRKISFHTIEQLNDGTTYIKDLTNYVACVLNKKITNDKYGRRVINIQGCGMDMIFHTIDNLSKELKIDLKYESL